MGRREVVQYFDDIDNKPLTEEEVNIIHFSVDGTEYVMDVSRENADLFYEAIRPFIQAARIEAPVRRRRSVARTTPRQSTREVREWAVQNGFEVADRGKIPQKVYEAYAQANN